MDRKEEITEIIASQNELMKAIWPAIKIIKEKSELMKNKNYVKGHQEMLHSHWRIFQLNHQEIIKKKSSLDKADKEEIEKGKYFLENHYSACSEKYLAGNQYLGDLLDAIERESKRRDETLDHPQLRTIEIPTFNGEFDKWMSFRDLFQSLVISRNDITKSVKLHHLKSQLEGAAAAQISTIAVTDDNFEVAWKILVNYYENKRLLVKAHIKNLLNLKKLCAPNSSELEELLSTTNQQLMSLQALRRPVENCDDFIIGIVTSKLDPQSLRCWEEKLGGSSDLPKWSDLQTFLRTRIRSMVGTDQDQNQASGKTKTMVRAFHTSIAQTNASFPCYFCRSSDHYLAHCEKFQSQQAEQRKAFVARSNLCFNCLGKHPVLDCKIQKRCLKCGNKHHTLIHLENFKKPQTRENSDKKDNVRNNHRSETSERQQKSMEFSS